MPRYMLSVFGQAEPPKYGPYASREEMLRSFADTGAFNAELEASGHFIFADGLEPPAIATAVDGRGESPLITDGPYLEAKEYLGGFWVIEAADLDEALALAAKASKACRGVVEVRPFHTATSIEEMLGE